jgi:hypothetical protein
MARWKRGCNPWATFSNKLPSEGENLQILWVEGGLIHLSQLSWGERDLTRFHLATFLTKLLGEEGGLATSSRKRKFLRVSSSNFLNQVAWGTRGPSQVYEKTSLFRGNLKASKPSNSLRKVTQWMNVACVNLFYNLSFMLYNIFSTSHSFYNFSSINANFFLLFIHYVTFYPHSIKKLPKFQEKNIFLKFGCLICTLIWAW